MKQIIMKNLLMILCAAFALTSCVDTVLLPEDRTVEEDFWKRKSDVEAMVNGAYTSMASTGVMANIIAWTSRSDELNVNVSLNERNLNQINGGTIQTTNAHNGWGAFYSVINACNNVISKSDSVRLLDPNYLEGDHNNLVGQMKALRALNYFYLMRAFRDVPLILEPYKLSSQNMNVPQSAPAVVLNQIINDLEEAKGMVLSSANVHDWTRVGYFTTTGIYAMLADAYLWRASVYNDVNDYDRCIYYCDLVRDRRDKGTPNIDPTLGERDDDNYNLNTFAGLYRAFNPGQKNNNDEILLNLIFEDNEKLCEAYNAYKYTAGTTVVAPRFYTNSVYSMCKQDDDHIFNKPGSVNDVRGFTYMYDFNKESEDGVRIRKFVTEIANVSCTQHPYSKRYHSHRDKNDNLLDPYLQDWIVYRVTDVMLMKAEALVQKARIIATSSETQDLVNQLANTEDAGAIANLIQQLTPIVNNVSGLNRTAMRQVQIVNSRAHEDGVADVDSAQQTRNITTKSDMLSYLTAANYNTFAENLEVEVMNERARELCFEGKRWYDMLRYNYRHTTDVNFGITISAGAKAPNYSKMLNLMARKYISGGSAEGGKGIIAKFTDERFLYFPVAESEMELNLALKQNPVYSSTSLTEKNY